MGTPHWQRGGGYWGADLVAWLLVAGLSGPGYGLEGPEPPAGEDRPTTRLHVAVRQGRLSVDLWEAEVGKVLARLAQEAGLTILGRPSPGARVSAQFTDADLEVGLRRLLRLASLSYAILHARSPAGAVVMQEVRVFRSAPEDSPHSPNVPERDAESRAVEASTHQTVRDVRSRAGPGAVHCSTDAVGKVLCESAPRMEEGSAEISQ